MSRIHKLQSCLPTVYLNDEIFRNKLLNAVKDADACKLEYYNPANSVERLKSDLHSSLATETTPETTAVHAHFVNHKHREERGCHCNTHSKTNYKQLNHGCSGADLRYIVCHKKDFWSTNHSKERRISALRKNKRVRQFVTEVDDGDDDNVGNDNDNYRNTAASDEQIIHELEDPSAHLIQVDVNHEMDR